MAFYRLSTYQLAASLLAIAILVAGAIGFNSRSNPERVVEGPPSDAAVSTTDANTLVQTESLHAQHIPSSKAVPDHTIGTVLFADGDTYTPVWRGMPRPTHVDDLVQMNVLALHEYALAGDPYAARAIHQAQMACRHAPSSQEELDAQLDQLQQTHMVGSSPETGVRLSNTGDMARRINIMEKAFGTCTKVKSQLVDQELNYLKLAADNGDPIAMIDYGNTLPENMSAEALAYFVRAWEKGDPEGLLPMSAMAQKKYETGEQPGANVSSAAIFLAYVLITEQRFLQTEGEILIARATDLRQQMEEMQTGLLPNQREETVKLAKDLIRSNKNCCLKMGF